MKFCYLDFQDKKNSKFKIIYILLKYKYELSYWESHR